MRTGLCRLLALVFSVAASGACLSEANEPSEPDSTVGSAGGVFRSEDGNVLLVFPSDAVTEPLLISVTPATDYADEDGIVPGTAYRFEPDGARFSRPVELSIRYDVARLPSGLKESSVRLHRFSGGSWKEVEGSSSDLESNAATGLITGFSVFGIIGKLAGTLDILAATTGNNLDPDGYTVTLDDSESRTIGVDGSVSFVDLDTGEHTVRLSSIASNCIVDGANPRTLNVPAGGTAQTTFDVICTSSTGDLQVSTSTSGMDLDPNGYTVWVDGSQSLSIGVNGQVTFSDLAEGNHSVQLTGVASNCTVSGSNPRTVSVPTGGMAQTAFDVSCTSSTGDLQASTSTTGTNLDPNGYTVTVDGSQSLSIGINGQVTFSGLAEGNHSVQLTGVASNCTVSGANPRTVSVPAGGTAQTTFDVSCTGSTGDLQASTSTTGTNLDPNGYTVTVDGSQSLSIGINGQVTFSNLAEGNHSVQLTGVASNCAVGGSNPRTVSVPAGSTAQTTFDVLCSGSTGGTVLVDERFENTDLASRGWYDLRSPLIVYDNDRGENVPEMTFEAGSKAPSTGLGRHLFAATERVYLSYWVRYSANWIGSQTSAHPHEFFFLTDADGPYIGPAAAQLEVLVEQTHCVYVSGNSCPGSTTGMVPWVGANGIMRANEVYFTDEPGPRYKNDWHHIEALFEMNSGVGVPDGIARYWYDGELVIAVDDVRFRLNDEDDGFLFNQFLLGPWMAGPGNNGSPITQTMWVDDIIIATDRPGS